MIQEEAFNTADEFLDALRITNQRWLTTESQWESQWIFRGQRKSDWKLIPSAWRTKHLARFQNSYREEVERLMKDALAEQKGKNYETGEYREEHKRFVELVLQGIAELEAVREFMDFADRVGHPVLEKTPLMNWDNLAGKIGGTISTFFGVYGGYAGLYPFLKIDDPVVALAQHHGIPTRLLTIGASS
jgi:hypothetical protein